MQIMWEDYSTFHKELKVDLSSNCLLYIQKNLGQVSKI